jgi:L-lactate dehydrogenase complex protein LldG
MTDDREAMYARLRESLGRLNVRAAYPDFAADIATPKARRGGGPEVFRQRLAAANTRVVESIPALGELLLDRDARHGYCDPALAPILGPGLGDGIELLTTFDRGRMDQYAFGITRASAGIVETGTLILKDRDTSDRLGALAPWIHIACLNPDRLYATLAEAITDLDDDPNVILVSGHSQTADVEGIMIHGVHGPGEQVCLFL